MYNERSRPVSSRIEEYWDWVAVACFLLITVDLLTSMYAAGVVGLEHEANPLMAWLLAQPLAIIVLIHTAMGAVIACLFAILFEFVLEIPAAYRRPAGLAIEGFLGVLIAVGLFVFANNLTVIVFGEALF